MFKRLNSGHEITFYFNDRPITANSGDSVAAALLANGQTALRQATGSAEPRGPFCLMGACYECLVTIEGKTVQACMITATQDMRVVTAPFAPVADTRVSI